MKNLNLKITTKNIFTSFTCAILLLNSMNIFAAVGHVGGPDFIINQRVNLNNIQPEVTKVELKCAVVCKGMNANIFTDNGNNAWIEALFKNQANFPNQQSVAGFSSTFVLPLNNGAINTSKRVEITANWLNAKKEHVGAYVCALGFYKGNNRLISVDHEIHELAYQEDPNTQVTLPAGIQQLTTKYRTFSVLNNLHNPINFQNCNR